MISLWWSVLYLSDDTALSPTEQLWDADGNGQLAHCPTGVWQRRRRLGKSEFSSWNVYHLYFYKSILNVNGWWLKFLYFCLVQPVIRCRPRSLFRSPSMPSPVSRPSIKRPDCPGDETTPVRVKRRRSLAGTHVTNLEQNPESPRMVSLHPLFSWFHLMVAVLTFWIWLLLRWRIFENPLEGKTWSVQTEAQTCCGDKLTAQKPVSTHHLSPP